MKNNHYSKAVASYIKEKKSRDAVEEYKQFQAEFISGKELAKMEASEINNSVISRTTFLDVLEAVCIKLREMGVIKDENDKTM